MTEERIEEIMVRDEWDELEEWRELRELIPILESKIGEDLASEIASAKHRKKKIEESVILANKDVL